MTNSKLHPLLLLSTTILLPFVISVFDSLLMIMSIAGLCYGKSGVAQRADAMPA